MVLSHWPKTKNMDWSKIKPLEEPEAFKLVSGYFQNHALYCKKIDPTLLPEGQQSPDFLVLQKSGALQAYCEVKSPQHRLNEITQMYHWDTLFNKLRNFLGTASNQFIDQDPSHLVPRIVAFTSNHPQLNWTSFVHNINGAVSFNGEILKDFRSRPYIQDSNRKISAIDLVIWMQISHDCPNPEVYQMAFFINTQSPLYNQTVAIAEILKPNPVEKIKLVLG